MIDRLSLVYSYYNQPEMLRRQCDLWRGYPDELKTRTELIIVDDCSEDPIVVPSVGIYAKKFRIEEDIPWNWDGARNLGMKYAYGWCLITDLDHMIDADQLRMLMGIDLDPTHWYQLSRRTNARKIRSHCNTYLMHTDLYWQIGGYDEAIHYYDKDRWFRKRLRKYPSGGILPVAMDAVLPSECSDASVKLERTGRSRNPGNRKPLTFNFTWRELA